LLGVANTAYLSGFLFCVLLRVASYCAAGGIRVVSKDPGLSGVSGSIGSGLCKFADTNIREHIFHDIRD
jgi:hypothetical protein